MVRVYVITLPLSFALMPSLLSRDPYTMLEMARASRTDAWTSTARSFPGDPAPPCLPALIPETVHQECHHRHLQVLVLSDHCHFGHVCVQPDGSQHHGASLQWHTGNWEVAAPAAAEREIYIVYSWLSLKLRHLLVVSRTC